jgi:hypothetical protein
VIHQPHKHQYYDSNPKFRFFVFFQIVLFFFTIYLLFPNGEQADSRAWNTSISWFQPKISVSLSFFRIFFIFSVLLIISQRWTGQVKILKYINILFYTQILDFFFYSEFSLFFFLINCFFFLKVNGVSKEPQYINIIIWTQNFGFFVVFRIFYIFSEILIAFRRLTGWFISRKSFNIMISTKNSSNSPNIPFIDLIE